MKKLNIVAADNTLKISVALINPQAVEVGKAKIIESDITLKEFDSFARKMKFNQKRNDTSLAGYYYINDNRDALVTYPSYWKKGEMVSIK